MGDPKNDERYLQGSPDIRIILCMFCGDPFSVESVLGPIMSEPSCQLSGDRSIIFETFLGDTKRKIEVIMSSYHGANAFRDELVHGFILLFSTKRRASLATLKWVYYISLFYERLKKFFLFFFSILPSQCFLNEHPEFADAITGNHWQWRCKRFL